MQHKEWFENMQLAGFMCLQEARIIAHPLRLVADVW